MLLALRSELDRTGFLFQQLKLLSVDEDEMVQGLCANKLTLLASGLVESASKLTLMEYARRNANPNFVRYVDKSVGRLNSLGTEKLKKLFGQFDPHWWDEIEALLGSRVAQDIDSLKAIRDKVAHGQENGTGFNVISGYYQSARKYAEIVHDHLVPD